MKVTTTARGYQSIQFVDQAGHCGIAEQSGGVDHANPTADVPGSSYLLLGRQDAPLQLNIDQVGELVEHLQKWLEEGKFTSSAPQTTAKAERGAKHESLPAPHQPQGAARRR